TFFLSSVSGQGRVQDDKARVGQVVLNAMLHHGEPQGGRDQAAHCFAKRTPEPPAETEVQRFLVESDLKRGLGVVPSPRSEQVGHDRVVGNVCQSDLHGHAQVPTRAKEGVTNAAPMRRRTCPQIAPRTLGSTIILETKKATRS